jgi:HEAT repeat protein
LVNENWSPASGDRAMSRVLTILVLITCLGIAPEARTGLKKSPSVPAGARLTLLLDKDTCFLGENVLVHLCVENTGPVPFTISLGGDYRGASRATRFTVLATDEQGQEVPDPDPNPMNMGGLGYSKELKQGDKHYSSLPLLRYRRFENPGVYRLQVSHDFSWNEADPSKRPVASATIKFVMPDEKQARQVINEMYQLPRDTGGTAGERRQAYSDFSTLIYPVYLPILAERAGQGDRDALTAIGHMPAPEATRELIRLLNHKDAAFARTALQTLNLRLPDPALENKIGKRNPFEFDHLHRRHWLVERSWQADFAPDVLKVGRRLLTKTDVESLQCGAYVVECLGTAEELPLVAQALTAAATAVKEMPREKGIYPRPRGACQELTRAARLLGQRGAAIREDPKTGGELILFACAIGARETFRPRGWEETLTRGLRHDLPYVREMALMTLPVPPPATAGKLLPELLADGDVDVQIAACRLAGKWKAPALRAPVLKTLQTAREHWLFDDAANAAGALGASWERTGILVERLDEEGMTVRCLTALLGLFDTTGGWGNPTELDVETGRGCKKAWQQFVARSSEAIRAGKKLKLNAPDVPAAQLFPRFTFFGR